ncbi:transcription termination factor Rho [candidate division WOR-3 bacterium]|nr:transcription termination factor Rho [candidate division WOR-3 bacterium]
MDKVEIIHEIADTAVKEETKIKKRKTKTSKKTQIPNEEKVDETKEETISETADSELNQQEDEPQKIAVVDPLPDVENADAVPVGEVENVRNESVTQTPPKQENEPAVEYQKEKPRMVFKETLRKVEGVLDVINGYGFVRFSRYNYTLSPYDVYVTRNIIDKYNLKIGDTVLGYARPPRTNEKNDALVSVELVNYKDPATARDRIIFDDLTPLYPTQRLILERNNDSEDNISMRIVDLLAPIGKGQRGLIVSPPKAGKTIFLQQIANSILLNQPECILIVLLIDERPEEVTDMKRSVNAEVISSTFDEPSEHHTQVANIVLEKARRLVEMKYDVVILLDSITRLARAHNAVIPHSGKTLSGGVDSLALHKPKRFFGAARNVEEGGSLTILATALIDTGSRMDEVIFEEFKGTGNMEIVLDRKIADKRIFPAVDLNKSGTRKEELLLSEKELKRVWILRKFLNDLTSVEAMETLIKEIRKTKTNDEFLGAMNG